MNNGNDEAEFWAHSSLGIYKTGVWESTFILHVIGVQSKMQVLGEGVGKGNTNLIAQSRSY
jgi:hypothetical protein